jgi:hypothetical protein
VVQVQPHAQPRAQRPPGQANLDPPGELVDRLVEDLEAVLAGGGAGSCPGSRCARPPAGPSSTSASCWPRSAGRAASAPCGMIAAEGLATVGAMIARYRGGGGTRPTRDRADYGCAAGPAGPGRRLGPDGSCARGRAPVPVA